MHYSNCTEKNNLGGLCSGCGMCAGICPTNALSMKTNSFGEYRPEITGNCLNCKKCIRTCPFLEQNPSEEEISNTLFSEQCQGIHSDCGYYDKVFFGFDSKHRKNSTSGGICTALLERLLEQGTVDAVVCVGKGSSSSRLFDYAIAKTPEELRKCARSAYYPVEMSEVIKQIRTAKMRIAIVCLPCFAKALRLACRVDKQLSQCIKYVFGLVCGQLPSKSMMEFVAISNGKTIEEVSSVSFREKNYEHHDGLRYYHTIRFDWKDGSVNYYTPPQWQYQFAFLNKTFIQKSCLFCDDIFAECADAVFMDAWLPELRENKEGTSIVISRDNGISEIINGLGTTISEVNIEVAIRSQQYAGVIDFKRKLIGPRIRIATRKGNIIPLRRAVQPIFWERMDLCIEAQRIMFNYEYVRKKWTTVKESQNRLKRFMFILKRYNFLFRLCKNIMRSPYKLIKKGKNLANIFAHKI